MHQNDILCVAPTPFRHLSPLFGFLFSPGYSTEGKQEGHEVRKDSGRLRATLAVDQVRYLLAVDE